MGANTAAVQTLYVAFFNRPGDALGQAFWEGKMGSGMTQAQIAASFGASTEYTSVYGSLTTAQIVSQLYTNLFGRAAAANEITFWGLRLLNGQETTASIALSLANNAQGTDATAIANKVSAATSFTNGLTTTAQIIGYSGTAANAVAKTWLATVTSDPATLTAANTSLTTTITSATTAGTSSSSAGSTFTLTTGTDTLTGTANNDTFIADNSGSNYTMTAGDSVTGGGGTDTLKVYVKSGDSIGVVGSTATETFGTISGIANLYINGTTQAAKVLDVSGMSGLTSLTLDTPVIAGAATTTVKVAGQSVTLQNFAQGAGLATLSINTAADTAANVTVNSVVDNGGTTALDLAGSSFTTLNLTSSGSATGVFNTIDSLTNSAGTPALNTLNISGSQGVKVTTSLAGLKTINASTDTGGVNVTDSATVNAAFAFTGGSGVNTLTLTKAGLEALTSGAQLNGGTGTSNTLAVSDAAYTLVTADYTAINKATGFQILGLVGADTVDASKLTSITHFADNNAGAATTTINNVANNSIVDITAGGGATTVNTFNAAVGANTISVNLGVSGTTAQGGTSGISDTVNTTGFTTVNLTSNGTGTGTNTVVLGNGDNTLFTVTGSQALTVTSIAANTTGSKFDAKGFTGALTITADSGKGDVILTGSGTTNITQVGAGAFDTVTYLAGHTKVDTITSGTAAVSATKFDVINNYVLGQDVLKSSAGALTVGAVTVGSAPSSGIVTETSAAQFLADAWAATGVAGKAEMWYDATNNNTWVVEFQAGAANSSHVIELVGVKATAITTVAGTAGAVIIA